jgi:hypothetical protein
VVCLHEAVHPANPSRLPVNARQRHHPATTRIRGSMGERVQPAMSQDPLLFPRESTIWGDGVPQTQATDPENLQRVARQGYHHHLQVRRYAPNPNASLPRPDQNRARDPGSTAKKVYWPPYTRTWCRDDWDDEPGGIISDHDRRLMEEYEAGGPLPPFLLPEPEPEPEQDQHQPAASFGRPSFSRRSPSLPRPSRVVCSSLPPSPSVSRTQPRSSSASQQQPVTSDMAMDDDDARSEVSVMSHLTSTSTLARDDQLHRDLRQQVLQLLRERVEHAQGPHNSNVTSEVGGVPRPAGHSAPGCGTSKSAMRRLVRRLAKEAATLDRADEQQRRL